MFPYNLNYLLAYNVFDDPRGFDRRLSSFARNIHHLFDSVSKPCPKIFLVLVVLLILLDFLSMLLLMHVPHSDSHLAGRDREGQTMSDGRLTVLLRSHQSRHTNSNGCVEGALEHVGSIGIQGPQCMATWSDWSLRYSGSADQTSLDGCRDPGSRSTQDARTGRGGLMIWRRLRTQT